MNEMKIEWAAESHIEDPDRAQLSTRAVPVVRLAAVDQVIAEAVKVLNVCMAVGEIYFKTCVLSAHAHNQIAAFLGSDLVGQWRKRQEGKS